MTLMGTKGTRRRFLAPEVVQTSAMDCGPATLKCLLEGHGIPLSYGRLREACQTDVDGTSIDTIEDIAEQLGLEAEQTMLPLDHLLLPEARALPAVVVVNLPNGLTHFVVAWRCCGPLVQLMDPASGRRWLSGRQFLREVYRHQMPLAARVWRAWAGSEEFLETLRRRLRALGVSAAVRGRLIEAALADSSWHGCGTVDAATRMADALARSGGLRRGPEVERALAVFIGGPAPDPASQGALIPEAFWSVRPAPSDAEGLEQVQMRGAVLVRVLGRRPDGSVAEPSGQAAASSKPTAPLSPELVAALAEHPTRPGRELLGLLRADGWLAPGALLAALGLAAAGVVIEALLFRGLLDVGRDLNLTGQRLGALGALLLFAAAMLLLELQIVSGLLRLGRRLEIRLRVAFLKKLPRLVDRYFQSRLMSDMAERCHSVHELRNLPELGGLGLRLAFELALTTAGLVWLDPASAPLVLLAAAVACGLPVLTQPLLNQRDLRVRTHVGALGRFYLDALLGLVAIRTHGAERAVRSEHESLLVEWARASLGRQRAVVGAEVLQMTLGFGLASWLVFAQLSRGGEPGAVLLMVYWALNLPVLGQELSLIARQYPVMRNVTLRLLEPLGAPENNETALAPSHSPAGPSREPASADPAAAILDCPARGLSLQMQQVSVRAAGHTILQDIDVGIAPGSQVAIVGPSGAGKSTLVGLLLGWHRPAAGQVLVDGLPLDASRLEQLRHVTAWVDPAVQLWNRSLMDNLRYGLSADPAQPLAACLDQAQLLRVLERLPDGMQTRLGEGGALLSGGEGQRVRFARALLRPGVRLVILDEPFRGLDRQQRRALLAGARRLWAGVTLLCITHDIGETMAFDRVLVLDHGRLVEDGAPQTLAGTTDSRYAQLLRAEEEVRSGLWSNPVWRRYRLDQGQLVGTT